MRLPHPIPIVEKTHDGTLGILGRSRLELFHGQCVHKRSEAFGKLLLNGVSLAAGLDTT